MSCKTVVYVFLTEVDKKSIILSNNLRKEAEGRRPTEKGPKFDLPLLFITTPSEIMHFDKYASLKSST